MEAHSIILKLYFILLLLFAIVYVKQLSEKIQLTLVFIASICINVWWIFMDRFLNVWDERFHALVAKNMIHAPLKPMLYTDKLISTAGYDHWVGSHIWLHKQPLFLWQIALSIKLFGANEIAVRIPSAIMASLMVLIIYFIAKQISNHQIAIISAIIVTSQFHIGMLVSGREGMEHNDIAFWFYISASLMALVYYIRIKKTIWWIAIGILAACAILCKWLVGLIVFAIWFFYLAMEYAESKRIHWKSIVHFITSLAICFITFIPWQLYILKHYPTEAAREFSFNTKHLFEVIEDHGGLWDYHIQNLANIVGVIGTFFIGLGVYHLYKKTNNKKLLIALLCGVIIVFLFFSMAMTKLPNFCFCISALLFICIGAAYQFIFEKIKNTKYPWLIIPMILIIVIANFNFPLIYQKHQGDNYWKAMSINKKIFTDLKALGSEYCIFNVRGMHAIDVMFYTESIAYGFVPNEEQIKEAKSKNKKIAIFKKDDLADYIKNDPEIKILDIEQPATAE